MIINTGRSRCHPTPGATIATPAKSNRSGIFGTVAQWVAVAQSVALALLLTGCGAPVATQSPSTTAAAATGRKPIQVIATFSVIGDLVRNVGGDKIDVTTLVGPDSDVHDFEPAPSDVARLAEAHIIFENGLDLETWLNPLVASSASKAVRVVVSAGIQPHPAEVRAGGPAEFDPHVWQSVLNAKHMVNNIAAGLSQVDAANAATYQANAETYLAKLDALDADVKRIVGALPSENRKLVTSHDALGYFAAQYGFTVVGDVLGSVSTEASEPSAQDIATLVNAIKAQKVKAIFLENITNPQLVERVAQEAGVVIGPQLYTDALGSAGSEGTTYIDAIRHNANAIVAALK